MYKYIDINITKHLYMCMNIYIYIDIYIYIYACICAYIPLGGPASGRVGVFAALSGCSGGATGDPQGGKPSHRLQGGVLPARKCAWPTPQLRLTHLGSDGWLVGLDCMEGSMARCRSPDTGSGKPSSTGVSKLPYYGSDL